MSTLQLRRDRPARGARNRALAVLALALALAGTMGAWLVTRAAVEDDARLRFASEVEQITPVIARRFNAYEQVLRGGVSVFNTFGDVTRDQWREYVRSLRIEDNYPGVQGIGFAEIVPEAGIEAHVARVRAEGFPDYDLYPRGERRDYSAIVYLEPFDWRNQRAFGFDMLSEPTRRAAMERARDTGEAALSGRVILVQETETDTQPGFLMYLPVYDGGATPGSIELRRSELKGFVYAPFRMGDLMRAILGTQLPGIRLEIYDGDSEDQDALLFDSAEDREAAAYAPRFSATTTLEPAGGRWTLRYSTMPGFEAGIDDSKAIIVLAAGVAVSLLVFAIAWVMARNTERARRQESDFRYLFRKNPGVMWVFDRETMRFLAVNDAAVDCYGYSRDEFLRMRVTDIGPPEEVPRLLNAVRDAPEELTNTGEWRHRTKAGAELIVETTSFPIRFGGRDAMLALARNRTEQRRVEAAHRSSEALRAAVLESSLDAIIVIDQAGAILEFNPAAERTLGYRRDDVLGRELAEVAIPPRHRDEHRAGLARYSQTGEIRMIGRRVEITAMRADGSEFPVELAINAARIDGRTAFTGYLRDVTDLRKAQAELQQAQKMDAIGRLTGGVAHDFNNLMTVVLGNAELLSLGPGLGTQERAHARQIIDVAERAGDLTRQLLAFARRQPLEPKEIDIAALVDGMEPLLRRTLGEHIEIQVHTGGALWHALADPAQLQSALLNVAINARDAMPGGGKLTIETRNVRLDEDYAAQHAEVTPGEYVMLAVSDTGTGMDAETLSKAFEPFYTTKEVGQGSGLGLSMIYGFAKQSGGHVNLYSELGQGTTVRLYLPRVEEPDAAAEPPAPEEAEVRLGTETILVVEDDELVRNHVEAQVRALGYRVFAAGDGPSGLALLKDHGEIDLLFTDVVMPGGMNGPELAAEAVKLRPGLRVLFTSGYTESAIVHRGRLDPGVHLLHKPYRRQELAQRLRQVLDAE